MTACRQESKIQQHEVFVAGAMREVMREGKLWANIKLDTLKPRAHLYGLGPSAYLNAELLIMDGKVYRAEVRSDSSMLLKEDFTSEAPFFVYTHVAAWEAHTLPDTVFDLQSLEDYLHKISRNREKAFAFKLAGKAEFSLIHLVNLPVGAEVKSMSDAHQGKIQYALEDYEVDMLGFFSTQHQGIFTHHDSFIHLHLISKDLNWMGHVDELHFHEMQLYLPAGIGFQ